MLVRSSVRRARIFHVNLFGARIALSVCATVLVACGKPKTNAHSESHIAGSQNIAATSRVITSSAPPKKLQGFVPPKTPETPPQLVACGKREFYRVGQKAFDAYQVADVVPPPSIRGSKVARQVSKISLVDPSNVVALGATGAFAIARDAVVRYTHGQKGVASQDVPRFRPLASDAPLFAWQDAKSQGIWAHGGNSLELATYALTPLPEPAASSVASSETNAVSTGASTAATAPRTSPLRAPRTSAAPDTFGELAVDAVKNETLAGFDGKVFERLVDGTLLYSTPEGLTLTAVGKKPKPVVVLPKLPSDVVRVFPDAASGRYWLVRPSKIELWAKGATEPTSTVDIEGAVIDADVLGDTVAVLSMKRVREQYQPVVTVFREGALIKQLNVGTSIGVVGQPQLDICLLPDRPWVVVGGKPWLQLLDWTASRLLAEW